MMDAKEWIGIIAGVVSLSAYIPYIYSIFKGKTKPSRSSWWIWSFVGFLILLSYYHVGARDTIWIPVVYFVCPLIVAILSIWFGEGNRLKALDKWCIFGMIISLVPWIIFQSPQITLFINIGIDFLGYLPTLKKTYRHPKEENRFAWMLSVVGSFLNIVAIENYQFSIVVYPAYMFAMCVVMMYLLFVRSSKFLKNNININQK